MKLSEAIRLGAMLKPQAFGMFRDEDGGTCAMGAALDAVGALGAGAYPQPLRSPWELWPVLRTVVPCPVCGERGRGNLWNVLAGHANNKHHWTREQIADWVETIERAQVAEDSGGELIAGEPVAPAVETLISVTR